MKHLLSILLLPIIAFGGVVRDLSPLNLPASDEKRMTRLPYDAEVEWIKGDGVAFALTPVIPNGDNKHRYFFDFAFESDMVNDTLLTGVRSSQIGGSICVQDYGVLYLFDNLRTGKYKPFRSKYYVNDVAGDGTIRSLLDGVVVQDSVFTFRTDIYSVFDGRYPIFGRKSGGNGVGNLSKAKLYRWWIKTSSGAWLMDLIPVRKGNVGYLYDRVTGTLCGNENTSGAFSFGPDVRPAVDVAMGNMNDWKNPYVTDGLVAMWDGEWNAGGDIHDSSANTIKELVSGRDFTIGGNHTWGEKYLSSSSQIYDQYLDLATVFSNGNFHVEIVLRSTSDSEPNMRVYTMTPVIIRNNNYYYLAAGDNSQLTSRTCSWWDNPLGSFSISFGLSGFEGYRNNSSPKSGSRIFKYPSIQPTDTFYLIKQSVYSGPYEFYTARIYNRVLTSSERTANYLVDKARFNIQ